MKKDYRFEGIEFYRKSYKKARHLKSFVRFYERLLREKDIDQRVFVRLNKNAERQGKSMERGAL